MSHGVICKRWGLRWELHELNRNHSDVYVCKRPELLLAKHDHKQGWVVFVFFFSQAECKNTQVLCPW